MLQTFQRHPGRHGAIADNADHLVTLLQLLTRLDHTVGRRYAGSRMTRVERIVLTFFTLAETAQSSILSERMEPLTTPGQKLMRIGLVTRVPYDLILGGV